VAKSIDVIDFNRIIVQKRWMFSIK